VFVSDALEVVMVSLKQLKSGRVAIGLVLALMLASGAARAAVIGDSLMQALAGLGPLDTVEVIVTFEGEGPPDAAQLEALSGLGLGGVHFRALPIAGVVATADQVEALAALDSVRSLWLNEQVVFFNRDGRDLHGVQRMRADANLRTAMGLPYSGRGIGVMVNDSGIDGTHPDLRYPDKVVQNVTGTTNLNAWDSMLPVTWVEDVPDTDIGSGHGTHVAGTVGGTGAASGGSFKGMAPGADIIGYGSGAVVFILDTIGGFDYALIHQHQYNIRVINNSWGTPSDTGTDFNPNHPVSVATKRVADRNIVVVFAAGNSGPGEGTIGGNYGKAPWNISVAAANRASRLAGFSSRGERGRGGEVIVDGESFTWSDRPTVAALGVDVTSAKATTDPFGPLALVGEDGTDGLRYTTLSGTSMAAPHVAGIVALMLEANPALHWSEVQQILEATATNLPGYEAWEAGAGLVNAHAAVTAAAGIRDDYGLPQSLHREFNAEVQESRIGGPDFELFFSPVGPTDVETFHVEAGLSTVSASANVSDNTVALVLTDPDGNRYGSGISLPILGQNIAVTAPAVPGEWSIEVRGIGSVSGVVLDPLGLTNGTAVPGTVHASVSFMQVDGFTGLDDIDGHSAQGIIEQAVAHRLVDSRDGGMFQPDDLIQRSELADYLVTGSGIRQFRPTDGSDSLFDVTGFDLASAEAVTARGGALRDLRQVQEPVVPAAGQGAFDPSGNITRAKLAYVLVQSLGMEVEAEAVRQALENEPITVAYKDERVALEDDGEVPAELRGYVQLALDFQLLRAQFSLEQGPFELFPTLKASFGPGDSVTRAEYAFGAVNYFDRFRQGN
jgi:subtilisin family serine protease